MFIHINSDELKKFLDTRIHLHIFRKPTCKAKYINVMVPSANVALNVSLC